MKGIQIVAPRIAEIVDVPVPEIADDEVLVKVHACVTCAHWDMTIYRGVDIFERPGYPKYPIPVGYPGHEMSGEVVEVGPAVTRFAVGDRVASVVSAGEHVMGFYVEYIDRPQATIAKAPDNISDAAAASLEMSRYVASHLSVLDVRGLRTAVVEAAPALGGTCLNWGCIPTKAMLQAAEVLETARHASGFGVKVSGAELDLAQMHRYKDKNVRMNTKGIEYLFKKNNVPVLAGRGKLAVRGAVEVSPAVGLPHLVRTQPEIRILAMTPDDPPHDRIMLAVEAGALGFISRHAPASEYTAAFEQVYRGDPWLPLRDTYDVLSDGAAELSVSAQERRARLTEVLLGLIPLTGLVAAITTFLWRRYWGHIGVRVADLGIDPASRMIDVLVVFVMIIGIFGPVLFVRPWLKSISQWIADKPRLARAVARARGLHLGKLPLGRLFINFWVAWVLGVALVVAIMVFLTRLMPLVTVLFFGPAVGVILVANVLDMEDAFPDFLHLPHLDSWRVLGFFGLILIVFVLVLGAEVLIMEPDLRTDGLHGVLAPRVLGFKAIPMMLYDLDGVQEPLGALYLGGHADLYVLYDPCAETVRLVPVGSSRVALIDEVNCRSQ